MQNTNDEYGADFHFFVINFKIKGETKTNANVISE